MSKKTIEAKHVPEPEDFEEDSYQKVTIVLDQFEFHRLPAALPIGKQTGSVGAPKETVFSYYLPDPREWNTALSDIPGRFRITTTINIRLHYCDWVVNFVSRSPFSVTEIPHIEVYGCHRWRELLPSYCENDEVCERLPYCLELEPKFEQFLDELMSEMA